ncbi:hypothetical protein L6E12_05110 [Actinokineospora sp. PR83]|uniref:hypothetical protein n=1 Tax=Actinokineospora sp. PR83 TaxID=2884908 RepID=UPI001F39C09B|nr:hypothetical protein [Actinokineospora sp. PR83]MCG8915168.1 hypothetical protein [Actinokineospora sp. PR83]
MYIDEGAGAPLDAIGKSIDAFAGAAAAGQFAVNRTGGDALLAAIKKMKDWIDDKQTDLGVLEQEPMLGASNAAQVMKPFVQQVATDAQGFITQLRAFRVSLEQAEVAIGQAMANYREADEESTRKFA